MAFDKNFQYIFDKEQYFQYIKSQGRYITSVEKNFGKKFDGVKVKIINENQGVVEGVYQVMSIWCKKLNRI